MEKCVLCGSEEFFTLDDGRSYCAICQTRNDDIEKTDDIFKLGKKITQSKTVKTQEKAKNWTSFEAFNIILVKQTEIIANICNFGTDFKKLVFSIWATYLEKNEIAFNDNVPFESLPKLQHYLLERDYNYIVNGEKELIRHKKSRNKLQKNSYRLGNRKVEIDKGKLIEVNQLLKENQLKNDDLSLMDLYQKSFFNMTVSDVEMDSDCNYDSEDESDLNNCLDNGDLIVKKKRKKEQKNKTDADEFLKKFPKNSFKRLTRKEKAELYLLIYSNRTTDQTTEKDDLQSKLEQEILEETMKLNSIDDEFDKSVQSDKLLKLKEKLHFSTFAKNIVKLGLFKENEKDIKRQIRKLNKRDVNHMTSTKTICCIYLAIRLLNYDIYFYDLIRWIQFNNIPYYSLINLLPNDWQFVENDYLIFTHYQIPQLGILHQSIDPLVNYLQIHTFPVPNIRRLIIRIGQDLNLPYSLIKYICNIYDKQMKENPITKKIFTKHTGNKWVTVPQYEIIAFGLIFLTLKNLFCLNDYHETLLARKLKSQVNNLNKFIWADWEEHMKFKLECFRTYIYPFKMTSEKLEIKNYDMYIDFYLNGMEERKHDIFNQPDQFKQRKLTKEATKELPEVFEKFSDQIDLTKIDETKIEPNLYPFKSYTEYINRNFKTRNDSLLNLDFKDRSIDYLFERGCKNIWIENPILIGTYKVKEFELNNEKIKFLFGLAAVYLNSYELDLLNKFIAIEGHFFSDYYEEVNVNRFKNTMKNNLKNYESFIDNLVREQLVKEIEESDQKNEELKIYLI